MTIPTLIATRFEQVIFEGRTNPIILSCRAKHDHLPARSVLCKARGCPELQSTWQLVAEVVGNATARKVGVKTPPPSIIQIDDRMASIKNKHLREQGSSSQIQPGFAAGCDFLPGLVPWTIGQSLSLDLSSQACRMFTFDQLSQNPDRRREKVNCGLTKDGLVVFDFELCFSQCFLPIIGGAGGNSWMPSKAGLAKNHLFYHEIRQVPPTEQSVRDMAFALSPEWWEVVYMSLPSSWLAEAEKIGAEIMEVREHADEFAKDILHRCLL